MSKVLLIMPEGGDKDYDNARAFLPKELEGFEVVEGADRGLEIALKGNYTTIIMGGLNGKWKEVTDKIDEKVELRKTVLVALESNPSVLKEMADSHMFDLAFSTLPPSPQQSIPIFAAPGAKPKINPDTVISPGQHYKNIASNIYALEQVRGSIDIGKLVSKDK